MSRIAPPCWQVQQRAWECTWALNDHALTPAHRTHVALVRDMHPDDLGWLSVVRMFVLYREIVDVRV